MISIDEHLIQVGRLFYAVAICDGNLHDQELVSLRDTLIDYRDNLVSGNALEETSAFNTADKLLAELSEESMDSWAYFTGFKNYYELHKEEFSRELKDLILSGIHKIATSYAKKNKSEIVLLAKTSLLFNAL